MRERKSLFIFLMGLAWKFRFSMPLLLSTTVAMLGRAWMFQIRVQRVQGLHEHEVQHFLNMLPSEEIEPRPDSQLAVYERNLRLRMIEEMAYYEDEEEDESTTWDSESTDSWETLVTEEAYG